MTSARALQILIINGTLPSRNDEITANRTHWAKGVKQKKEATERVAWECVRQHLKPMQGKCSIRIRCYEPDMRRDSDNVQSGAVKPILDGLKLAGIIKDDSRKYVKLTMLPVELDKENPRIEVWIEDID
jgi:Holliday junction resolvase RusA-like endonuclease